MTGSLVDAWGNTNPVGIFLVAGVISGSLGIPVAEVHNAQCHRRTWEPPHCPLTRLVSDVLRIMLLYES